MGFAARAIWSPARGTDRVRDCPPAITRSSAVLFALRLDHDPAQPRRSAKGISRMMGGGGEDRDVLSPTVPDGHHRSQIPPSSDRSRRRIGACPPPHPWGPDAVQARSPLSVNQNAKLGPRNLAQASRASVSIACHTPRAYHMPRPPHTPRICGTRRRANAESAEKELEAATNRARGREGRAS